VYELVDANRGIQKVRLEHATRSAVATCYVSNKITNQTSQLAGKAYEDSNYTIVIAAIHLLKHIMNSTKVQNTWRYGGAQQCIKSADIRST